MFLIASEASGKIPPPPIANLVASLLYGPALCKAVLEDHGRRSLCAANTQKVSPDQFAEKVTVHRTCRHI